MKKIILFSALAVAFTSCTWVEPNYEGVLMENYGKNGINDFSVVNGKVNTWGWGTELIEIPMWNQRGDCSKIIITTKDGGRFDVDPTYSYTPIRGRGRNIAFEYRHLKGDSILENIEKSVLDLTVIDAYRRVSRTYSTDSLLNHQGDFEAAVEALLRPAFIAKYFTLTELTSNLAPPKSMADAIERRNKMIQEAEAAKNGLEVARMNALQKVIEAEAEAKANTIRQQTLTPLLIQQLFIEKWDGRTPLYGTNPTFFKNIQ